MKPRCYLLLEPEPSIYNVVSERKQSMLKAVRKEMPAVRMDDVDGFGERFPCKKEATNRRPALKGISEFRNSSMGDVFGQRIGRVGFLAKKSQQF